MTDYEEVASFLEESREVVRQIKGEDRVVAAAYADEARRVMRHRLLHDIGLEWPNTLLRMADVYLRLAKR